MNYKSSKKMRETETITTEKCTIIVLISYPRTIESLSVSKSLLFDDIQANTYNHLCISQQRSDCNVYCYKPKTSVVHFYLRLRLIYQITIPHVNLISYDKKHGKYCFIIHCSIFYGLYC